MGMARDEAEAEAVQGVKLDFKRNVKRNMLANAASSGIRLLFPFLNRTLFLWLMGAILSSGYYIYAACVLFAKTFGVRDARPVALCLSALAVSLILVLHYDTETTLVVLKLLYRNASLLIGVPFPLILLKRRRRNRTRSCADTAAGAACRNTLLPMASSRTPTKPVRCVRS